MQRASFDRYNTAMGKNTRSTVIRDSQGNLVADADSVREGNGNLVFDGLNDLTWTGRGSLPREFTVADAQTGKRWKITDPRPGGTLTSGEVVIGGFGLAEWLKTDEDFAAEELWETYEMGDEEDRERLVSWRTAPGHWTIPDGEIDGVQGPTVVTDPEHRRQDR